MTAKEYPKNMSHNLTDSPSRDKKRRKKEDTPEKEGKDFSHQRKDKRFNVRGETDGLIFS